MEILILRDGAIFARARTDDTDTATYTLQTVLDAEVPAYPEADAGRGKSWELQYEGNVLAWVTVDRELTQAERIEVLSEELDAYRYPAWIQPTGAHDAYAKGAAVSHHDKKWISDADANVWEPGVYGWTEETQ